MDNWIHVSVEMARNPDYGTKSDAYKTPYIRASSNGPYRCRDGQVRGKAASKAYRRERMRIRMQEFAAFIAWLTGEKSA